MFSSKSLKIGSKEVYVYDLLSESSLFLVLPEAFATNKYYSGFYNLGVMMMKGKTPQMNFYAHQVIAAMILLQI